MPEETSLGALLARLRAARGLKVPDVIEKLKLPKSTAYGWEGPKSRPEVEQLQSLLDFYEANAADRLLAWKLRATPLELPSSSSTETPEEEVPTSV